MNEEKWMPVPEEIQDLFDDAEVAEQCRDECIRSFWRAKRAIMYGTQARKARRKAWDMVNKLYPELEGRTIEYNFKRGAVIPKTAQTDDIPRT